MCSAVGFFLKGCDFLIPFRIGFIKYIYFSGSCVILCFSLSLAYSENMFHQR